LNKLSIILKLSGIITSILNYGRMFLSAVRKDDKKVFIDEDVGDSQEEMEKNSELQKRMYVIVRGDLSSSYRMVQGAHALAEFQLKYPEEWLEWNNHTLIFLMVPNLRALRMLVYGRTEKNNGELGVVFQEPDLDCQLTAMCCYTDGVEFAQLPLA